MTAVQGSCVIVRWDANSNGSWDNSASENDSTGFRLESGALETQRGATSCEGKGWEKLTDPDMLTIAHFVVRKVEHAGFAPEVNIELAAIHKGEQGSPGRRCIRSRVQPVNRQRGMSSLALVLLLLVLGTLILTGLNQQLTTFSALVGGESRSLQQQATVQSALEWGRVQSWSSETQVQCKRHRRGECVCAS